MASQNLNVSGQDALLIDNSRSYFHNVGYTRTSNFQFKLKHLDSQNVAKFGATTTFKVHKQDHLLGPVDLRLRLKLPDQSLVGEVPQFLTNKFGFAMLERVRFLVGSNLIQEIDGEWLDMENTLYREPKQQFVDIIGDARKRPDFKNGAMPLSAQQVISFNAPNTVDVKRAMHYADTIDEYYGTVEPLMPKTNVSNTIQGRVNAAPWVTSATITGNPTVFAEVLPSPPAMPAFTGNKRVQHSHEAVANAINQTAPAATSAYGTQFYGNPEFIEFTVPLSLFFAKHPSMYLPVMAVASSQDLTIEIRLRDIPSLMQHWHVQDKTAAQSSTSLPEYKLTTRPVASTKATFYPGAFPEISEMQLVCHYFQLSAAEADALQIKPQHVRLIRQVQSEKVNVITMPGANDGSFTTKTENVTLSFLHPVATIWLVLRDPADLANNEYFRYLGKPDDDCRITSWDLVINGQSRMPEKTDVDYTMQRIVPLIHGHGKRSYGSDEQAPILSIDFALNGQSHNPSGHLNMNNATNQSVRLELRGRSGKQYQLDIYAITLNWCNIQGGTAKVVFN